MLARNLLETVFADHSRRHEPPRRAERPALSLVKAAAPKAIDWLAAYPCTRMHGAAFEAEFYPADSGTF